MNQLGIFTDSAAKRETIRAQLGGLFDLRFFELGNVHDVEPQPFLMFDVSLRGQHLLELKEWLKRRPKDGRVIFVTDKSSHVQSIQAQALGATDVVHRPLDGKAVIRKLLGDFDSLAEDDPSDPIRESPGVSVALDALQSIFSSACLGEPLNPAAVEVAGQAVVSRIESQGLGSWVDTIRRHHSQTYQHSLIVTGVAVAFGQQLGVSRADRLRLSFAGMLHDIGKARVPLTILEKPTALEADEMAILRKHPEFGIEALKSAPALHKEMLDIVLNHHEYLDGSGYPNGLMGAEISDLVRILTISDVFGALLERRAYKAPLPGEVAYRMLCDMGPKLDKDLVREFRFASAVRISEAA